MKSLRYALPLLLLPVFSKAQNITGIWRGHFRSSGYYQRSANEDDRYRIEVQVAQTKDLLQAVTYSYKSHDFYGKADADGSVNDQTQKVLLRELRITEVRMISGVACAMTCRLQYSRLGNEEFLQGTYTSRNSIDSSDCGSGTIFLHKVVESDFPVEPFVAKRERELAAEKKAVAAAPKKSPAKKSTPPAPKPSAPVAKTKPKPVAKPRPASPPVAVHKPVTVERQETATRHDSLVSVAKKHGVTMIPPQIATRSNEVIRTIEVSNTEITLSIYDDGAIDNDTVSVYYDNRLLLSRARLTTQPIVLTVQVEPGEEAHELTMVAENLGDIPPNTSLLVVRDGDKRQEVRIATTEQKNAVIRFRAKPAS